MSNSFSWWLVQAIGGRNILSPIGTDREIAIIDAKGEWDHLSEPEKNKRDEFYLVLVRDNEDGTLDIKSGEEYIDIKKEMA